jgi:phosphate transport system protein
LKHFERDCERLSRELFTIGGLVEEATAGAVRALVERRRELAEQVIQGDRVIDSREVELEEHCLKVLALHRPVAIDLRFILAVLKVNNDLERMGDQAVNIAERALALVDQPPLALVLDMAAMAAQVQQMVRKSLNALVQHDVTEARQVRRLDDEIDELNRRLYVVVRDLVLETPTAIERALSILSVSRNLERIADLATNIAEDVIFLVEGEVVRHRRGD